VAEIPREWPFLAPWNIPFDEGRRLFLQQATLVGAGAVVAGSGLRYLTGATHRAGAPGSEGFELTPTSIEEHIEGPMFDLSNGHYSWLSQGVLNNPIVFDVTKALFQRRDDYKAAGQRSLAGNALYEAFNISLRRLNQFIEEKPEAVHPDVKDNLPKEALHIVSYALPFSTITWITEEHLAKFDRSLEGHPTVSSSLYGAEGTATLIDPIILGIQDQVDDPELIQSGEEGHEVGTDRWQHFIQYFGFNVWRRICKENGISMGLPRIAELALLIPGRAWGERVEAELLSLAVNLGYEAKTTPRGIAQRRRGHPVTQGLSDKHSGLDIWSGMMGAYGGNRGLELVEEGRSLQSLVLVMNDPRIQVSDGIPGWFFEEAEAA
jgi:hypothetical protein